MQQISGERLQDHWSSGFELSVYKVYHDILFSQRIRMLFGVLFHLDYTAALDCWSNGLAHHDSFSWSLGLR